MIKVKIFLDENSPKQLTIGLNKQQKGCTKSKSRPKADLCNIHNVPIQMQRHQRIYINNFNCFILIK